MISKLSALLIFIVLNVASLPEHVCFKSHITDLQTYEIGDVSLYSSGLTKNSHGSSLSILLPPNILAALFQKTDWPKVVSATVRYHHFPHATGFITSGAGIFQKISSDP